VRFLNVAEPSPRKNLKGLLRAWLRATRPDDDAVLLLKIGTHIPGSEADVLRQFAEAQADVGKRLDEAAPACSLSAMLSDAQMPRLFSSMTHYLSLSHAEGWDQPMIEAAATDLHLIAPAHSAYLAYLDPSLADLVPSREVPAQFPGGDWVGRLFDGVNWWEPDEEHAVGLIRAAIDGRHHPRQSPRAQVANAFTWRHATERPIEILTAAQRRSI
jgi:hypothetical protein